MSYTAKRRATLQPPSKKPEKIGDEAVAGHDQPSATVQPDEASARDGCTLIQYAQFKRLPPAFLRDQGLSDIPNYNGAPAVRIPYFGPDGHTLLTTQFRLELRKLENGPDTRFKFKSGSKAFLYGQWRIAEARAKGYITLVEGASDCHTLWFHGEPALGLPGAHSWDDERDAPLLDGIPIIYVIVEPDTGGAAVLKWMATSRLRERARLVRLGEHKDPSELHITCKADREQFAAAWEAARAGATPYTDVEQQERAQHEANAWARCAFLARQPDILSEFARTVAASGVAGAERIVKALYLAVTSRMLARPISMALKGPSSAGKSYLTERVLAFFPPSAFYALSAMSERALAYSDEPLKHRILVIYEAAGLRGEFATYLVRSLLSEGCVRYETVMKTHDGLQPRLIVREGPTGLLVTTTAVQLHPENETRMLSVPVIDTREQTKAVLLAQAKETHQAIDFGPWHALQEWIQSREHRVTIPFAEALASLIPPVAVRLRRDFPALLTLIRAHAILHQQTRDTDGKGRIVAALADYAAVRELVADLMAEAIEATVASTVRETVAAVQERAASDQGAPVTVATIAVALKVDKSAAHRRVQSALKKGYLRNLEEKPGRPARLVIGDPMPNDVVVLPDVETLRAGCKVADGCEGAATTQPQEDSASNGQGCRVASDTREEEIPPPPRPLHICKSCGGALTNHGPAHGVCCNECGLRQDWAPVGA